MNKKQTLFEQRKAMQRLRSERLANGMCQACGEEPRTSNLDNTRSVFCELCKIAAVRAKQVTSGKRPPSTDEYDIVDDYGWIDDGRLDAYAELVRDVIYALPDSSIAEHKRALGGDFNDLMHMDALDSLMAEGDIRERLAGSMMRYEPAVRHDRNQSEYRAFPGNVSQQVAAA